MANSRRLLEKIAAFNDQEGAVVHFEHCLESRRSISIGYANAFFLDLFKQGKIDLVLLNSLAYLYRDGIAIKLFMKFKGVEPGFNANGTDLNPILLETCIKRKLPIALIGDEPKVVQLMADKIRSQGGNVVCSLDGFSPVNFYIEHVATLPANSVIFLAMGMPRQEKLALDICRIYPELGFKVISTGAFFKFYTASIPRAPAWMRSVGMEWLYRLFREPKRMFDRYILGLFRILFYWISEKNG